MSADALLFDSTFVITSIDQKKYDRVSRIGGSRESVKFTLDINCEIYPVQVGDTIQMSLASTLSLDGVVAGKDGGEGGSKGSWREQRAGESSLADTYDYVCHGKMYRFEEGSGEVIKVYASFGGLLLFIEGPHKRLSTMRHEYIYLLIKK